MRLETFLKLPNLPLAQGAATPIPVDGNGSLAYSTTRDEVMVYNGGGWQKAVQGGEIYQLIKYPNFAALPTLGPTDFQIALAGVVPFYWNGYAWSRIDITGIDTTNPANVNFQWAANFNVGPGLPDTSHYYEWTVTFPMQGVNAYTTMFQCTASPDTSAAGWPAGGYIDADEAEMDSINVMAVSQADNFVTLYMKADPGPVHGNWRVFVRITQ